MTLSATSTILDLAHHPLWYRTFQAVPEAVKEARHFVTSMLRLNHLASLQDDVQVVISELVTNALHVPREWKCVGDKDEEIAVGVIIYPREIMLLCWDCHLEMPQAQTADAMDEHGRGLSIVACMSREWGVMPLPLQRGKWVWAVLDR